METLAFLLQTAVVTRSLFLVPFEGRRKYARLTEQLRENPSARLRFFARFLLSWWTTAAVVLISIAFTPDTPAQLRLVTPTALVWPLTLAWLVVLGWPVWRARESGPYRDAVKSQLGRVPALLPRTRSEKLMFAAVAITAGVCEELVFRGLIPLYFTKLFPGTALLGALIGVLGFGIAHAYQGVRGIVLTSILGALFMAVTLATGSVCAAMIFHALTDLRILALVEVTDS